MLPRWIDRRSTDARFASRIRFRRLDVREQLVFDPAVPLVSDNLSGPLFEQIVIGSPTGRVGRLGKQNAQFLSFLRVMSELLVHPGEQYPAILGMFDWRSPKFPYGVGHALVHSTHAATMTSARTDRFFLFLDVGYQDLRRQHERYN